MDAKVYEAILAERRRQDEKWGEQDHTPVEWMAILAEEVGETSQGALRAHFGGCTLDEYHEEMVQVAAVAVAALENLERVRAPREDVCPMCEGDAHGASGGDCPKCGGEGRVAVRPIPFVSTFTLEERRRAWLHNHADEPFPADLA